MNSRTKLSQAKLQQLN
jgi:ubiquitin-activating enzyme E1